MSNVEPQNVEGWFRFAQSFLKWTVRHKGSRQAEFIYSMLDVRPARNALKLVRGKFNNLIHNSMITLTQRTMHGRRVFDVH
jgi:hypothetical protein